ncbi:hypothetical protein HMPREF9689_00687 [Klebsiella oxytoca 10-5245]|nr:hypothetical protein HMPREF9689_00687 [Klebsiella oxytoca 10-5245]EUC90837.1 hypothetical protein HMPREF1569_1099 [Klebsiella oxytoca OK-1]
MPGIDMLARRLSSFSLLLPVPLLAPARVFFLALRERSGMRATKRTLRKISHH